MAVTLNITKNHKSRNDEEFTVYFGDDGEYWYLHPFFKKVEMETNEYIDLYDDCVFKGENLVKLRDLLEEEISRVCKLKNDTWQVKIGTQTQPEFKELFDTVIKMELIEKLKKWNRAIEMSIKTNEFIWSHGD